jgi:hypothetical protein
MSGVLAASATPLVLVTNCAADLAFFEGKTPVQTLCLAFAV